MYQSVWVGFCMVEECVEGLQVLLSVRPMTVSSTYLNQRLGWSGNECMACSSRSSMKRLTMMGDRGEPMGVLSIYLKKTCTTRLQVLCLFHCPTSLQLEV